MKQFLLTIGLAAFLPLALQAQTNGGVLTDIGNTVIQFFKNNPTNTFDVSGYGLMDTAATNGFGGGARLSYWPSPMVGASIDLSYCDRSWTFASLAIDLRGTIHLFSGVDLTPYGAVGPGWNIQGKGSSPVVFTATGGSVRISPLAKYVDAFFGEFQYVTTSPPEKRFAVGLTKRF